MTSAEEQLLSAAFSKFESVSLFGKYRSGHQSGVDVRDLGRFQSNRFLGVFASLLFDYFEEHEKALAECWRVLADGGILFTHIASYRLSADEAAPKGGKVIKPRAGYFEYLGAEGELPSITVGRQWFVKAMSRAGFEAEIVTVEDKGSGLIIEWFVGMKRGKAQSAPPSEVASPAVARSGQTERLSRSYSTAVDPALGFKRVQVELSVPSLPSVAASAAFACHAFDSRSQTQSDLVVAGMAGGLVVSDDMGANWNFVAAPEAGKQRLLNVHCLPDATSIIQPVKYAYELGAGEPYDLQAPLYVFDRNFKIKETADIRTANWHGSRSVGDAHGTILFAEYPENSAPYRKDFEARYEELKGRCRDSRVFRSTDGGKSWQVVFEKSWRDIRHFHTVAADPYQKGIWWLSSGDTPKESRVWRSSDDGLTWTDVTDPTPSANLHPAFASSRQAVHRYTDLIIDPDRMIWGSDDWLGGVSVFNDPAAAFGQRAGSRIFVSSKTQPLSVREIAYVGNPVRSIIDVGPAYVLLTEAKRVNLLPRAQVVLMSKQEPFRSVELFTIDNFSVDPTSFSTSKSSRVAKNGRFFSLRASRDVFADGPRLLQWDIAFE